MGETVRFGLRAFAALSGLALASLLVTSGVTSARDRPGTPNNEKAYTCGDYETALPAVCVEFNNTASEPVGFDIEMTVNGEKVSDGRPHADCMDRPSRCTGSLCSTGGHHGPVHNCEATAYFNNGTGTPASGRTGLDEDKFGRTVLPQAFRINDLEYDANYCFRFKARRASDGVVSETWSNWACVQTAAAPPSKPTAPQNVVAEYIPGGIDWRKKPPKAMLKWERGGGGAQIVQKRSEAWGTKSFSEVKKLDLDATEFLDVLNESDFFPDGRASTIFYRICAVNISGATCSQVASTFRPPVEVESKGPSVGEVLVDPNDKLGIKKGPGFGEILKEVQPPASEQPAANPHEGVGDVFRQ